MDIVLMRTDGTGIRQLTNDLYKDRSPKWSPDGSRIAFHSERSGSYEIWTVQPDGSGLEQLTDAPDMEFLNPLWARDGSRIAALESNTGITYTFDPNQPWKEQHPEALPAMDEEGDDFQPYAWSPDGTSLAGSIFGIGAATPSGIVTFSFEKGTYLRLTDFGDWAEWLADSQTLLIGNEGKVFTLDTRSKETRELLSLPDGAAVTPTLSRDNRTMYFTLVTEEANIWLLDLK